MILPLLLLASAPLPVPVTSTPSAPSFQERDIKAEYEERRAAAEGDVEKLWNLIDWCEAHGLTRERRSCLHAILRLDDENRKAHEMLGHVEYDGKWFTSEKKLEAYKQKEEERRAKEQGFVRYGDEWVKPEHVPYLEKGLVQDSDGSWVDPEELRRLEEGWVRQDLTWIPPDEIENIEKGLWKCGEEWLPLEEANAYHAELGRWWTIPHEHFVLHTTLSRQTAMDALAEMERAFADLVRIYGRAPSEPLPVVLVSSADQYSQFAAGDEQIGWNDTEALGLSSVHGAFFAEMLFDPESGEWMGTGAGMWDDSSDASRRFGVCFARHAAGQSFGEFVDPSPSATERVKSRRDFDPEKFWGEKRIPFWFRYGAATYVERYYVDSFVDPDGDPYWTRRWSVQNILSKGGLDPLSRIFDFKIGPNDPETSAKLLNESGLLVAFVLDGDVPKLKEAHAAVKDAIAEGDARAIAKAFRDLEKAISAHEDQLRAFAEI